MLQQQLQAAESDLATTQSDKVLLVSKLKPLKRLLAAASKGCREAEVTAQQHEVRNYC